MRFSLMTEPHLGGTYEQMLSAARLAEERGLVSFARCDHFLTDRDPDSRCHRRLRDAGRAGQGHLHHPALCPGHPDHLSTSGGHRQERGEPGPDVRGPLRSRSGHRVDGFRASIPRDRLPGMARALGAIRRSARLSRGGVRARSLDLRWEALPARCRCPAQADRAPDCDRRQRRQANSRSGRHPGRRVQLLPLPPR